MSVVETVLVFAVIPLGTIALLALLVFGPSLTRAPRYRPGRPWDFDPVWYVPHRLPAPHRSGHPALRASGEAPALAAGRSGQPPASVLDAPTKTARGGAHGRW